MKCRFIGFSFATPLRYAGCLFGVKRWLASGAGFEAFVQPVILRDLLADARFDKGVHAAHVGGGVLAGVVFPCGVEAQDNAAVGLARGDGGDDFGAGHLGDARQACDGGRLNAEKVDEQRVFCAEVLVGQVEKGGAFAADVFDDAAQAFGAPDKEDVVVAVPPVQDLRVERGVFLVGIDANQRHVLVERVHGGFEGGEMGVEQDDFFACG